MKERRIHLKEGEMVSVYVEGAPHAHFLIGTKKDYLEVYLRAEALGIDQSDRAVDHIKRNLRRPLL